MQRLMKLSAVFFSEPATGSWII